MHLVALRISAFHPFASNLGRQERLPPAASLTPSHEYQDHGPIGYAFLVEKVTESCPYTYLTLGRHLFACRPVSFVAIAWFSKILTDREKSASTTLRMSP